ncbi:MAG: TAXI family TRAP transporter solute-binding subunit [bacterium]
MILILLVVGFAIAWQFVPPAPEKSLRIATGSTSGAYYRYAEMYKAQLAKSGVELIIEPTAGSVDALAKLRQGQVDLAFVQGGVAQNSDKSAFYSIASLFYEPFWVFYQQDLSDVRFLADLKGKRLAIGDIGSGTRALSLQLLQENGINDTNTTFVPLNNEAAKTQLSTGQIDAAFFVMSPNARLIDELTANPTIRMMDFTQHAQAYTSHYHFLDSLNLGEGMINLRLNIPVQPMSLLSTTATLVTQQDIHPRNLRLLLDVLQQTHSRSGIFERPQQFPSEHYVDIPIHHDAEQYLRKGPSWVESILPFWLASKVDRLKIMLIPLLTLLLPLLKGAMPIYRWRIRSKIYRWYGELKQVDGQLDSFDLETIDEQIANLKRLHNELAKEVSLPLSYMSEFYALRLHTDHILNRLKEHRASLVAVEENTVKSS